MDQVVSIGTRKQQQQLIGFKEVSQLLSNPMDISTPGYGSELTILESGYRRNRSKYGPTSGAVIAVITLLSMEYKQYIKSSSSGSSAPRGYLL